MRKKIYEQRISEFIRKPGTNNWTVRIVVRQEILPSGGRHYDILTVEFARGKQENYYFDIKEFFGKFTGVLAKYSTKKEAETE